MVPGEVESELPKSVRGALNAVRWRLRAYVFLEGLAIVFAVVGLAFWLGLLGDWWFEPSPFTRFVSMAIAALAIAVVVYRGLLRRVFVRISDASAATLLERRFPELRDHILTTVHFADSPRRTAAYHPELVARTSDAAKSAVARAHTARLFRGAPLLRALVAALAAVLSITLFAVFAGDAFGFFMKRLTLANDPWPRRVQLEVVGFPNLTGGERTERVAEEDDFELIVRARLDGYQAPRMVEIRTRAPDGRRDTATLIRVGQAVPGRDEYQLYRHEFQRVVENVAFDVVGGDDRVRDLNLQVVKRPELHSLVLECQYPSYLERAARTLAVTGGMRIPAGTRLVLAATSTKPLIGARIRASRQAQDSELSFAGHPTESLQWDYGVLTEDDVLLVTVSDTDGVTNRDPYRVSVSMIPDELPQVAVRTRGIGNAITSDARIPFVGKITDEYGLKDIWFEFQVDGEPPQKRPFAASANGKLDVLELEAFDTRLIDSITGVRPLTLVPGQRLSLAIKASDRYDLSPEPRTGSGPMYTLDVVTAADLLALLERRELELRQRFEAIYEKMTDTRNLLNRVDFNDSGGESGAGSGGDATTHAAADGQPADETALDRARARRRLRVGGAIQNIGQSADETLGVAEAFDEIHDQLTNNRIDNSDLKMRLREQIAVPLRQIAEQRMPELTAQVQLTEDKIDDVIAGPASLELAIASADRVLVEMQQVLERMLELETYNEVLGQLRDILNDQEELRRKTQERQRERLRGIFDSDN